MRFSSLCVCVCVLIACTSITHKRIALLFFVCVFSYCIYQCNTQKKCASLLCVCVCVCVFPYCIHQYNTQKECASLLCVCVFPYCIYQYNTQKKCASLLFVSVCVWLCSYCISRGIIFWIQIHAVMHNTTIFKLTSFAPHSGHHET